MYKGYCLKYKRLLPEMYKEQDIARKHQFRLKKKKYLHFTSKLVDKYSRITCFHFQNMDCFNSSSWCMYSIQHIPAYPSGELEFTPPPFFLSRVRITPSLALYVMLCRTLFVLLYFFFWSLCSLSV